jgi:phage terminase large subunit
MKAKATGLLQIQTPAVFHPLTRPARYKGAFGGRGSGKSHFFGELLVAQCQDNKGMLAVCIREIQRTLAQSSKRLIEDKIRALGLGRGFRVLHDRIVTPGDGLIIFNGMQDHTAESIKSLEGFQIAWIDEAQVLSARSLQLLRPTIRAAGSEIWASWNPRRKSDAIDDFFRNRQPAQAVAVQANWRDNPWFPPELEQERQLDLKLYPDRYRHIWEGDYASSFAGAYFATLLGEARAQGLHRPRQRRSAAAAARLHRHRRQRRAGRCLHDLDRAMGRPGNPHSRLLRGHRPGAGLSRQLAA